MQPSFQVACTHCRYRGVVDRKECVVLIAMDIFINFKVTTCRSVQNHGFALALVAYCGQVRQFVALSIFYVVQQSASRGYGQYQVLATKPAQISGLKLLVERTSSGFLVKLPRCEPTDCHMITQRG